MVGGNVSFYNETLGQAILPTPVIGMAGILDDAEARCTQWFAEAGDRIALLGPEAVSLGGSEFLVAAPAPVAGRPGPARPGGGARRCRRPVAPRSARGCSRSAHDCAEGGLAVTLAECCVSGPRRRWARMWTLRDRAAAAAT